MNNITEVIEHYEEKIDFLQNKINNLTIRNKYLENKHIKNRELIEEMIDQLILSDLDDSHLKEYGFSKENIKKIILDYYDKD